MALPAALARIEGIDVRLGSSVINIFNTWTDPTPGRTVTPPTEPGKEDMKLQFTPIPLFSASYGGRLSLLGDRGWGVGVAFQPFGGARVAWPDQWAGRYRIIDVDRRVYMGALTAGIEVLPQVRVGGGLVYHYTTEKLTQAIFEGGFPVFNGPPVDTHGTLDVSGGALGYDASLEIDPMKGLPLTVAVDYKHKATQDLSGDVSFDPQPAATVFPPLFGSRSAKHQLTIPNRLNVGVAYRVVKPLLVTGTYTFERWVVYDQDLFTSNTGFRIPVTRDYVNGHTFRFGAEWDALRELQLRAGFQRDVSGYKKAHFSPTLPDVSSWAVSAGLGYRFTGGFYADAAVFYAIMDKVNVPNPAATEPTASSAPFRGSYEISALIYGLTVGWRPGGHRPAE
jgi:long-chain fatty acid transport protein